GPFSDGRASNVGLKAKPTKHPLTVEASDRELNIRAVLDEFRPSLRRDRGRCELSKIDATRS
ncbi:hypothetical protein QCM80_39675, partial [Bradyrhizobium sp. SSUT112]|nr:hypothetical protein [Bradyrhizobium sp. SSUT112]